MGVVVFSPGLDDGEREVVLRIRNGWRHKRTRIIGAEACDESGASFFEFMSTAAILPLVVNHQQRDEADAGPEQPTEPSTGKWDRFATCRFGRSGWVHERDGE